VGSLTVPIYRGMAAFASRYQAMILDLWGVVHDGIAPYPGVLDCLARLGAAGTRIVILSNAPRRSGQVVAALRAMGIADALYTLVVTSGDATRAALERRDDPWYAALGRRYLFLGKEGDANLLDGLDYDAVGEVGDADFLLNAGLPAGAGGGTTEVADYDEVLRRAAARGLPMACANPDLAVIRGGVREPCAGALAARYAALGGAVSYRGKPDPAIYGMCFGVFGGIDRGRVLAIGDGLATDIAGARAAGIDSLLVTGGLLADAWGVARETPPDAHRLATACAEACVTPTAAIAAFVW
jgi:HAD superfamily hydrolase (TIGR01459 family)